MSDVEPLKANAGLVTVFDKIFKRRIDFDIQYVKDFYCREFKVTFSYFDKYIDSMVKNTKNCRVQNGYVVFDKIEVKNHE